MDLLKELLLVIAISSIAIGRKTQMRAPTIHEIVVRRRPSVILGRARNSTTSMSPNKNHVNLTKQQLPFQSAASQEKNERSNVRHHRKNDIKSLRKKVKSLMRAIRKGDRKMERKSRLYRNGKIEKTAKRKNNHRKGKYRHSNQKNKHTNKHKSPHPNRIRHFNRKWIGGYRSADVRVREKGHKDDKKERGQSEQVKTLKSKKNEKDNTEGFQLDILVEQLADAVCALCQKEKLLAKRRPCVLKFCLAK